MHILLNFSLELDERYIVASSRLSPFSAFKVEHDCSMHSASFLLQISTNEVEWNLGILGNMEIYIISYPSFGYTSIRTWKRV